MTDPTDLYQLTDLLPALGYVPKLGDDVFVRKFNREVRPADWARVSLDGQPLTGYTGVVVGLAPLKVARRS